MNNNDKPPAPNHTSIPHRTLNRTTFLAQESMGRELFDQARNHAQFLEDQTAFNAWWTAQDNVGAYTMVETLRFMTAFLAGLRSERERAAGMVAVVAPQMQLVDTSKDLVVTEGELREMQREDSNSRSAEVKDTVTVAKLDLQILREVAQRVARAGMGLSPGQVDMIHVTLHRTKDLP